MGGAEACTGSEQGVGRVNTTSSIRDPLLELAYRKFPQDLFPLKSDEENRVHRLVERIFERSDHPEELERQIFEAIEGLG